jgi:hypothetical protein
MSLCVFNAGDKKVRVARMKQKLMAVASAAVILTAVAIPNKAGLGQDRPGANVSRVSQFRGGIGGMSSRVRNLTRQADQHACMMWCVLKPLFLCTLSVILTRDQVLIAKESETTVSAVACKRN